jgi:mono/diheme cytochrome c family protein
MKRNLSIVAIFFVAAFMYSFVAPLQEKKPWNVPAKYKNMENPYADEAEDLIDAGADIYAQQCASCHGDEGLGDGAKASNLKTYPGDFSSDEFKAYSDGELYYMSIIGRGEMPNFEKKLSDDEDQWAVIEFIKSL